MQHLPSLSSLSLIVSAKKKVGWNNPSCGQRACSNLISRAFVHRCLLQQVYCEFLPSYIWLSRAHCTKPTWHEVQIFFFSVFILTRHLIVKKNPQKQGHPSNWDTSFDQHEGGCFTVQAMKVVVVVVERGGADM